MATKNKQSAAMRDMPKGPARRMRGPLAEVWGFMIWLVGVLVSLAVGFGMTDGTLTIPFLSDIAGGLIVVTAGWIVVVLAILGAILKIIDKASI